MLIYGLHVTYTGSMLNILCLCYIYGLHACYIYGLYVNILGLCFIYGLYVTYTGSVLIYGPYVTYTGSMYRLSYERRGDISFIARGTISYFVTSERSERGTKYDIVTRYYRVSNVITYLSHTCAFI